MGWFLVRNLLIQHYTQVSTHETEPLVNNINTQLKHDLVLLNILVAQN